MKIMNILEASDVSELVSLGPYREVKALFEKDLGYKLGVNGWDSFFSKVQHLKIVISSQREYLLAVCKNKNFKESKVEISNLLEVNVKANSLCELTGVVSSVLDLFSDYSVDPYEYYEKTKFKKFQDSSKLEGMNVEVPDENETLESVLKKYRR